MNYIKNEIDDIGLAGIWMFLTVGIIIVMFFTASTFPREAQPYPPYLFKAFIVEVIVFVILVAIGVLGAFLDSEN